SRRQSDPRCATTSTTTTNGSESRSDQSNSSACQPASLSSPIILSMRERLRVSGPNVYTTCGGGPRCRKADISPQLRNRSCLLATLQRSSPAYRGAVGVGGQTGRLLTPKAFASQSI